MALTRENLIQNKPEAEAAHLPVCAAEEIQPKTVCETAVPADSFDPETVTRNLVNLLQNAWNQQEKFLFKHCSEGQRLLTGLKDLKIKSFQPPESVVALLSGVSGGKSSYMNTALCHYPICPVATTTTTICAVELRRASLMSKERIEVCLLTDAEGLPENTPVRVFGKQVLNEALFQELLDYAVFLGDHGVLNVADTLDFFLDENGELLLHRTNWRHCMVLFMIVLNAYVFQDKQEVYQEVNVLRNRLMEKLGIPLNRDYCVRLYWCSEDIPENTVLVDLPGLGSATQNTEHQMSHTNLTASCLAKAASALCFVEAKGVLDSDTLDLLNSFIKTNTLKGSSSARLTFVLHKADMFEGRRAAQTNGNIQTSINSFRNNYPITEAYPVYALSSYNGEWLMLDSGILPENLHHAVKYPNATGAELRANLRECCEREYPYQLTAGSAFGLMNYETFNQELLGNYVRRIQFLTAIEAFREYILSVTTLADTIAAEQSILKIAQAYQPELAAEVSDVISKAADDAKEEIYKDLNKLTVKMERALSNSQAKLVAIAAEFNKDYQQLSIVINDKLKTVMDQLERQGNNIPTDGNFMGGNEIGKRNEARILACAKSIGEIQFLPYFDRSFKLLNDEFDEERKLYDNTVEDICNVIRTLPEEVANRMDKALEDAVKVKTPSAAESFRQALQLAQETTRNLLVTLCEEYVSNLHSDHRVEDVINTTANNIQKALLNLLQPYKSSSYGHDVLTAISKLRMFRANIIDAKNLESFLKEYYIGNFQKNMESTLLEHLAGRTTTADSHFFRLKKALADVQASRIEGKPLDDICAKAGDAGSTVKSILGSPTALTEWQQAINIAAKDAQKAFDKGSIFEYLYSIKEPVSNASWSRETMQSLLQAAESAHKKTVALLPNSDCKD